MSIYRCQCILCEDACKNYALRGRSLCGHCLEEAKRLQDDIERKRT